MVRDLQSYILDTTNLKIKIHQHYTSTSEKETVVSANCLQCGLSQSHMRAGNKHAQSYKQENGTNLSERAHVYPFQTHRLGEVLPEEGWPDAKPGPLKPKLAELE